MEPLEQIPFCPSAFILSSSSREPLSPQFLLYMVWRRLTRPRMGCVQVQPIRATHSPSHREWIRNAHRIQSGSMSISWDSCRERQECLHLGRSKTSQQPSYHVGRCGPTKANTEGSRAKSGKRQFCVPRSRHT